MLPVARKSAELLLVALFIAAGLEAIRRRYRERAWEDFSRILYLMRNALLVTSGLAAVVLLFAHLR